MSKITPLKDWKIGDKFRIVHDNYAKIWPGIHTVDDITSWVKTSSHGGLAFEVDEIEKIENIEMVLVVNKIRPEYSTYVDCGKEAIEEFFLGTRIFDFYVIKDGKLIDIKSSNDIESIYSPMASLRKEILALKNKGDSFELDGKTIVLGCDLGHHQNAFSDRVWFHVKGTTIEESKAATGVANSAVYLRKKGESCAWWTLEEFADMIETGNYHLSK